MHLLRRDHRPHRHRPHHGARSGSGGVAPAAPAVVLIEDGLVVAVGPDLEIPEEAEQIELTGLHLIPGLIDGFCTLDPDQDALWLASGVTTVRDGGMTIKDSLFERPVASRDVHPGPQLLVSSPLFMDAGRSSQRDSGSARPFRRRSRSRRCSPARGGERRLRLLSSRREPRRGAAARGRQAGLEYRVKTWGGSAGSRHPQGPRGRPVRLARARLAPPPGARFGNLDEQLAALSAAIADLAQGDWKVTPSMGTGRFVRWSGPEEPRSSRRSGPSRARWRGNWGAFRLMRAGDWRRSSGRWSRAKARAAAPRGRGPASPWVGRPERRDRTGWRFDDELEERVAAGIAVPEVLALATRGPPRPSVARSESGKIAPGYQANCSPSPVTPDAPSAR